MKCFAGTNESEDFLSERSSEESPTPILNVSEKDSPYALISKFFSSRESNHRRMRNDFERRFFDGRLSREQKTSIGQLEPDEVQKISIYKINKFNCNIVRVNFSYKTGLVVRG